MSGKTSISNPMFYTTMRPISEPVVILTMFLLMFILVAPQPVYGQTYRVLYNFTGGADGGDPDAGLTIDRSGSLYGTASDGGYFGVGCSWLGHNTGCGTVFRLVPSGTGWAFSTLYHFRGGTDGAWPYARVIIGGDGSLYGTTLIGGMATSSASNEGCGTVFKIKPSPTPLSPWTETVIYPFQGGYDGSDPLYGDLISDQAGNIYGTTDGGGFCGGKSTAYELVPSGGEWIKNILYTFTGGIDGSAISAGLVSDIDGNLYGTTLFGGNLTAPCEPFGCGTIFQLKRSGSGWTKTILLSFDGWNDGELPYGGLMFDASGNLYGTTNQWGPGGLGTVFKLTPSANGWAFTVIYSLTGGDLGSFSTLVMDGAGSLYGTIFSGGSYGKGNVFKLTPSGDHWTYTSLYDFTGGDDGGGPVGNVILDAHGNLYGTTQDGGTGWNCPNRCGVVFEITP